FGAVAAGSLALAVWAGATPMSRPVEPQPLRALVAAATDRRVLLAVWFVLLPAMLFGTLSVLGPLRLSHLGFGAVGIGAVWLVTGMIETVINVGVGRAADRYVPLAPIRIALVGTVVVTALLPWPDNRFLLGVVIGCAGLAFGTFYAPGMTILTHAAEERALDYGYAFALVNLAWAPGQSGGSAVGGALAEATSDAVPYLALSGIALLTLARLWRSRSFS